MRPVEVRSNPFDLKFIKSHFSNEVTLTLKRWININYKIERLLSRIHFLKVCKNNGLIPRHLSRFGLTNLKLYHARSIHRFEGAVKHLYIKIINIEIFDLYRLIDQHNCTLTTLSVSLSNCLPAFIWNKVFDYHSMSFDNCYNRLILKVNNKIEWLKAISKTESIKKIKPLHYFYSVEKTCINNVNYSLSNESIDSNYESFKINIDANSFYNYIPFNMFDSINKKWFLNISKQHIPHEVSKLVQLGDRFSLPLSSDKVTVIHEFVKDIECNIKNLDTNSKFKIRNSIVPRLRGFMKEKVTLSLEDLRIMDFYKHTCRFVKDNPNVIFTRADKGNATVAIDKNEYINSLNNLFNDSSTYTVEKKNPVKGLETRVNSIVKRWYNNDYISKQKYYFLRSSDSGLPRAYGLPKIHKPGFPYRVIVSSTDSPLHNFARFLHDILHQSLPTNRSYVKNSFYLFDKLSGLRIQNCIIGSLDVVSLFTNVPTDLALTGIRNRWSYIAKHTNIPMDEFIDAVEFVLSSTYFTFDNVIYRQTFGTPMGSPLSPVVADIVLQDLENKALYKIGFKLPLYFRFVDDIIFAAPNTEVQRIVDIFNSFHTRLQFSLELETNRTLNFLDLQIKIDDSNTILLDWYHKATFSGRYLNFYSHHPQCHKIGTVFSLIDRACLLSHPFFHQKNLTLCINLLLDNGYPLPFIFKYANIRLKKLILTKINNRQATLVNRDNLDNKKFIAFPYIKNLSEFVSDAFKATEFAAGYKCLKRLDRFVKVHKDNIQYDSNSYVIYQINCKNCDASYVGQTSRKLKTRIGEHMCNVKNLHMSNSVIAEHVRCLNHQFDWTNVKILDKEHNFYKRLISETIHIKKQKNGLNIVSDTELLNEMYFPLFDT